MIIRILTEGQFNLPGSHIDQLNEIDNQLVEAVESEDRGRFKLLLKQMLDLVRQKGTQVPVDELIESDLILPEPDITLKEAEELYPWEWVGEAFKIAAAENRRRWGYISAILRRWAAEGKDDGKSGRYSKKDNRQKYLEDYQRRWGPSS